MNILDHIAIRLACPACGNHYDVPLSDVMLSHEVVRTGCPVCHETECPPVFQVRLFGCAEIKELGGAWKKVVEKAERAGGELVVSGDSRDRPAPNQLSR
jgi:ssDNA-binding Zn-finger/Zn-ribbon topoisomerase 1